MTGEESGGDGLILRWIIVVLAALMMGVSIGQNLSPDEASVVGAAGLILAMLVLVSLSPPDPGDNPFE